MFFDSWQSLLRVLVVGPLAYAWLIVVLRVTGKRTLVQLNAFDFVVTVALGSTLATAVLSKDITFLDGAVAVAVLAVLQLVVAWTSVRVRWARRLLTAQPRLLLHGQVRPEGLRRTRISEASLRQTLRSAGLGGPELAAAVVLETNGTLSVIRTNDLGGGQTLAERTNPHSAPHPS